MSPQIIISLFLVFLKRLYMIDVFPLIKHSLIIQDMLFERRNLFCMTEKNEYMEKLYLLG